MRRRPAPLPPTRTLATLLALALTATRTTATAAEDGPRTLRTEVAGEIDSNVHRTEQLADADAPPIVASPVTRLVLRWFTAAPIARGQTVSFGAVAAGKLFTRREAQNENLAVVQTSANWQMRLGERNLFGAQALLYDAFQQRVRVDDEPFDTVSRDFQSFTPALRFIRLIGNDLQLNLTAGYRRFVYKPDRSFDFQAPTASLLLRWTHETQDGEAEWDLAVFSSLELRQFKGARLAERCSGPALSSCLPRVTFEPRADQFFTAGGELSRTGRFLAAIGYGLHWNRSQSYGEQVLRQFVTLRLAVPLPFAIYASSRIEVLFSRYSDPLPVLQRPGRNDYVSIEDENRSSGAIELSRALTERLHINGRFVVYVNELGGSVGRYRRYTGLVGLTYTVGR